MKTSFKLAISMLSSIAAATCGAQTVTVPAPTTYQIARQDANSEVLQQTFYTSAPSGKIIPQVRSITKIATGLNYWTGAAWSASDPTFQVSSDGQYAFANNVQTPVRLSANLAASNSVSITTPDGIVLNTTPVAIGFYDAASGNSLIIASVTNCTGTLIGSNQVLYESAFVGEGISADVLYTLQRGSFSQDVIWKQNIDPADYGFPTNSTRIQIFSAFNAPMPQETARPIYVETNQTIRAQMASPDFVDHTLKFGQLEFGPGRALSTTATNRFGGAPIAKDFQTINGESYLVESIEFKDIRKELQSLPQPAVSATVTMRNHGRNRKGGPSLSRMAAKGLKNLHIPVPNSATRATFAIKSRQNMVADALKPKGVVADYIALPATEPDPMVFRSDTTYFVDGEADFDNVVLEGGAVFKFPNDTTASIEVDGNFTCETHLYLPAIFTAADDDSVGQSMSGIWTNYTGTVQPGGYANPALYLTGTAPALSNLRISDAYTGVYSENDITVTNLQVVDCGYGFYIYAEDNSLFENVLVANANCAFGGDYTYLATAENVTVANCNLLLGDDSDLGVGFYFYNSIFANVTNTSTSGLDEISGNNNGLYNFNPAGFAVGFSGTTTNVWPFQNAGACNYYLTKGCVFHGAGTTNNIDPALLADLAQRTTWPPIIYDATNISLLGTLAPQAERDTNSSPDLGFHESCVDYLIGGCDLSNTLAVASGTAIGWFVDHDPAHGIPESIALNDGANLSFNGTATRPSYFAESALLQENGGFNWYNDTNSASGALAFNGSGNTNLEPELSANFSKWTSDGNADQFSDSGAGGYGIGSFKNCELYNGQVSTSNMLSLNFTNCLFFREAFSFWGSSYAMSFDFENCTFYNGQLAMARSSGQNASFWSIENSAFDGTLLAYIDSNNGASGSTAFDHNAYNTNNLSWQTYGFPYSTWIVTNTLENLGSSDLLTTNYGWESIPFGFGDFYLPTNSPLLHMGSTNANFLGLYHFTTQTNQTVEGTNFVTIGYHYVATTTNAMPWDSNGDGVPDYSEDANGDGLVDDGETNWALAILTQPVSQIAVFGANASFYLGADGVEPLSYQWYFSGTNIAWATNSTLTLTNVQAIDEGLYFAVVSNFSGSLTSSVAALEPSGLIGWWPGEGNTLDNAGPNYGEITNGITFTNGVVGQAFKFDGNNGYILVSDSPILKPTNLTIEAWVRFTSLTSKDFGVAGPDLQIIAEKPDINPTSSSYWNTLAYGDGYILFKQKEASRHDNFEIGVTASDSATEVFATNSAVSIQTNVWYFVAAVRGSNYIQIYVNGQSSPKTTVDFDQSYGTAPLYFGSSGDPEILDGRLKGNLDEVALYNRALSSNEIQATYNAEQSGIRNCFVPPVIVTQPSDQRVTVGTTATLLVAAAGSPPLSYQWSFNGTNIVAGATNATLLLPNVQGTNTGNYSVVVSNNQGTVTSSGAFLTAETCFSSVDVAMVIDDTCSVTDQLSDGTSELSAVQIAATNFVQALNVTNDQAALFSFNNNVTTNQTLTDNVPDLLNAIGSLSYVPSSYAIMGNALQISQSELAGPRHNPEAMPVMIFVSEEDPADINSGTSYGETDVGDTSNLVLEAATLVKAAGTRLITIALSTNADSNFMALMASSPSDTYYATNLSQLTNVFNSIATSICLGTNTAPPATNTLSVQIISPTNQTFIAGSNIVVSATVTNWPDTVSLGWVEFFAGTNVIGFEANTNAITNTLYQTYWMPMNAGTDVLTAFAIGTNASGSWSGWSAPVTNVVLGVPAITITSPANGTNLGSMYQSTLITAAVTPAAGATIMNVSYYTNGVLIGTNLSSPPYPITSPPLPAGVYTLYATATDTNGAMGISSNVIVTVDPSNQPPFVYAGPTQITNLPLAQLTGFVSDDGLPSNYLAVTWSLISGPTGGTVMFGNSNLPSTTVTFNMTGTYTLQLSATDGQLGAESQVQISILETNLPPIVSAPPIQTALWPAPQGSATNDSPWISAQWISYTDAPAIDDEVELGLAELGYNAQSNCLMKTGAEDMNSTDGNGDEIYQYSCLYFDNGLNLTGDLGPYGYGLYNANYSPPFASVENTNGGFTIGDNFFSTAQGVIMRIKPDGETVGTGAYTDMNGTPQSNAWMVVAPEASAPSDGGYFKSLWVDQTGTWGGDLLGLCSDGNIWRMNSLGQATLVGQLSGGGWEGAAMTVVPYNVPLYGPWAGRLLVDNRTFGDAANIYAVDTNGFVVHYDFGGAGACLVGEPVPQNENLFVDQGGEFEAIPASWLNGVAGDMLLTGYPVPVLLRLHWNGASFDVHQSGAIFYGSSEVNYLHFAYCPLGGTNLPETEFRLQACVSDDGKLFSATSNLWTEVSGPGSVTFEDPALTNTLAQFSAQGTYVLRFSANDGQFTSSTNVQVNVVYNEAPTVNAGTNQIVAGTNATLSCLVQDDGFPSNELSVTWSVMDSPAGGSANLNWTNQVIDSTNDFLTNPVTFTLPGTYIFQATANDGMSSRSAEVTVTVESARLTLSPSFGWPTLTNTPFTVTATLVDSNNVPITNAAIQFTVSDLSDQNVYMNWSTNTDSNGNASLTYTSASQRGDLITAQVTGQSYEASIQKDWALEIGCDSIVEGGNWTCTSLSMPPVTDSTAEPVPFSADYYIFQGTPDSTATLSVSNLLGDVDSGEQAVNFVVRDPSNNVVALCDDEAESDGKGCGQLTFPVKMSGNYLVELVALDGESGDSSGTSYGMALSCNDGTNVYAGAAPDMQLLFNGTNVTSGGTITFPPTVPYTPTNIALTISNAGTGDLTVDGIYTNCQSGAEFIISNNYGGGTIRPGGSSSFTVFFNPFTNGMFLGQLAFYGNVVNGGCYMAYLSGNGFGTNAPPSVVITSPQEFSSFYAPAIIPLTAQVTPGMTNVTSVVFEQIMTNGTISLGNASLIGTNQWELIWPDAVSGNRTIAAVATDAAGETRASPPISITVDPMILTNLPPVVSNAYFNVQINSVNDTLNPLASDYDPNGNPLTILGINPPENGTAAIIDNGQAISYTPKAGFYSESVDGVFQPFDEFNYQVSDGHGATAQGLITVYVYPEIPPSISITNPVNLYSTTTGTVIQITASITNIPPQNIARVEFYLDGNPIGVVTNGNDGSYSLPWTNIYYGDGVETFTAQGFDVLGEESMSLPVKVNVAQPAGEGVNAALTSIVGSYGPPVPLGGSQLGSDLITIQDGVFQLNGQAYSPVSTNVTWELGVYSPDGSTLLRNLTPASTGPVGSAGSPGVLLQNCDLTTLQNGVYDLRLTASEGFTASSVDVYFRLESNLKIGAFSFSQQDLVIPVNGIPLTVTRTYNSLNPDEGAFGYGWTYTLSDMDASLDETRQQESDANGNTFSARSGGGRDITLTLPNGQRTTFYYDPIYAPSGLVYLPRWDTAPGMPGSLKLTPGPNSAQDESLVFALVESYGGEPYWEDYANASDVPDEVYDFPDFNLTTPDGTTYLLERPSLGRHPMSGGASGDGYIDQAYGTPYLAKITELNGDTIAINSNSIVYTSGTVTHQIMFQRNSLGLISSISDPNGIVNGVTNGPPAMVYQYDSTGNLLNVLRLTDRSGAGTYVTNTFTYTNSAYPHYITGVIDADGTQIAKTVYNSAGQIIEMDDAYGNKTQYIHNTTNDTETVVDPLNHATTSAYDSFGNVIAQTNALGEVTKMAYDQNNNKTNTITYLLGGQAYATNSATYSPNNYMLSSTDPLGHTNGFTYNNYGEALSSSDAMGNTTSNGYDGDGDLVGTTNALGETTVNTYDNALLVSSTDPVKTLTLNTYDPETQNLTDSATLDYPSGAILSSNTYTYDGNNNRLTSTTWRHVAGNLEGDTTTNVYDAMNRVIETINPDGGSNTIVYDLDGQQQETIDALGNVTSNSYDALGRLTMTTYPDGTTETSAYDGDGNRTNSVDRLGRVTIYQYDALNRLTNTIYPDNATSTTVYDDVGRVAETIEARGTITANGYDVAGQRIAVTNAFGITGVENTNYYSYDADGNQITFTDANGHTTTNVYDVLNRQVQVQYPDGTATETVYDGDGRSVTQINQDNVTNEFGYDGSGRLISVTNAVATPQQIVTRYQYDEAGNEIAQIDALLRTNTYSYDGMGRRIGHTMPGGQSEGFGFDFDGNQICMTNFNGAVITNLYDSMNRLIARVYPNGTSNTFTYTLTGQRATMNDASGSYVYAYDLRDRMVTNAGPAGALAYGYDADGNVTNIQSSTANGTLVTYQYDPLNRLTNVVDGRLSGAQNTAYHFDPAGNLQGIAYPNAVTNLYQFDSLNRLTNLVWNAGSSQLASFAYTLGLSGNRVGLSETISSVQRNYTWQYDHLYRLTNEIVNSTPNGSIFYQYDNVGNRLSRTAAFGLSAQSSTYTTNDWLATDTYDNNGNTIASSGTNYQYDYENRLTNFNNGQVILVYDADGNRVKKIVGTITTLYLVDTLNPSGYPQVLEELTVSGGVTNLSRGYTWGLGLITQRIPGSSTNFYCFDGHGSTRFLTDLGGTIANTYTYDAFGNLINSTGTIPNNFLYCCYQNDPDVGLVYDNARYLNLNTGRFWTMDGESYGNDEDPLSLHKYLYTEDAPLEKIDPSGHGLADLTVTMGGLVSLAAMNMQVIVNSMGGVAVAAAVWQTSYDQNAGSGPLVAATMAGLNFTPGEELGMVTKVAGKVVGKAFASGGLERVGSDFAQRWFASTGGKMSLKTANGVIITLSKGNKEKGFKHIIRGHLVAFWDGNLKKAKISLWPISADKMLQRLEEAAGKYVAGGAVAQPIVLSDGTKVMLVVRNNEIVTFYPDLKQTGVVDGKALAAAAK